MLSQEKDEGRWKECYGDLCTDCLPKRMKQGLFVIWSTSLGRHEQGQNRMMAVRG